MGRRSLSELIFMLSLVFPILIGEIGVSFATEDSSKNVCSIVLKKRINSNGAENAYSKLLAEETKVMEQRHGVAQGLWKVPLAYFGAIKRVFRWLNHKHLNYAYLDDVRLAAELYAHPAINGEIKKREEKYKKQIDSLPASFAEVLNEKDEAAAQKYFENLEEKDLALNMYGLATGSWWGPRRKVRFLIEDVGNYEERIHNKVQEGVMAKINEGLLFKVLMGHLQNKNYPLMVELVKKSDHEDQEVSLYNKRFLTRNDLLYHWREVRSKRRRIFPRMFSKGEIGEMEEIYAKKLKELESMVTRFEVYEKRGELPENVQKRLLEYRKLKEEGLMVPSYVGQFYLDQVIAKKESEMFFNGRDSSPYKEKLDRAAPRSMHQYERDELIRELEIVDLSSLWGQVRNTGFRLIMVSALPVVFTVDGAAQGIVDFGKATWTHLSNWSESYMSVNEPDGGVHYQNAGSREAKLSKSWVANEIRMIQVASYQDSDLFMNKIVPVIEARLGRLLEAEEKVAVRLEFEGTLNTSPQSRNLGQLILAVDDEVLNGILKDIVELRFELLEKRKVLGEDFELYQEDLLQKRIGERVLERALGKGK